MPGSFSLEIVTPERLVYSGEVSTLQAPGLDGYFGVLYNRAPLISALGPGQVRFQEVGGGPKYLAISGGFFQIAGNKAVVLADEAAFAEEIDPAEAAERLARAKQHLQGLMPSEEELEQRRLVAQRAAAWVKVASQVRR